MRMGKNGPTTPIQQLNQIRWIAETEGVSGFQLKLASLQTTDLITHLDYQNRICLVTIGWLFRQAPEIIYGDTSINYNATPRKFGYHTMIVAAHQPQHQSPDGVNRPWGFINSWMDAGKELFWMSDTEFTRAWSTFTPLGGFRSTVILTKLS